MGVVITQTANPAGVSASSNVATYTGAAIGTAAPNRIVVVVVGSELASTPIASCTIDGNAMTAGTQGNQGAVYSNLFYLAYPTGTTANIAVTFTTNSPSNTQNHIAVYSVTDAVYSSKGSDASTDMDATDPLTTGSTTIGTGGGMIAVAARAGGTGGQDTWSNLTEDLDVDGGAFGFTTAFSTTAGTATRTCTATTTGEDGAMSWIIFADNSSPTTALNTPADSATGVSTTPTLNFTGTDAESDAVEYEVQIYKPVATDAFTRADNSSAGMNLGANWTGSVPQLDLGISSNQAYQTANSGDNVAFWSANSLANNQYVQAKMAVATTASSAMGVVLRASATDYVLFQQDVGLGSCKIYWYNAGAYTQIGSTYTGVFANNDVIRLEAIGTTFNAYINNVLVISGTNGSAPSSGKAGILIDENGDRIDDFECGDIIVDALSASDAGFSNPDAGYLADSYPNTNDAGGTTPLSSDASHWQADGQSINGNGEKISSVKWRLKVGAGSPTGNAVAKVYAHSGTYGTSSVPTGAALATSDNVDVSTLTGSMVDTEFTFSGANQITLTSGTKYFLSLEYSGGDASNYIRIATDNTSPTHAGNEASYQSSTWTAASGYDNIFYLYTTDIHPFLSGSDINYVVQSALSNSTVYYWRVRGIDPSGSNSYGAWATTRSFTTTAGGGTTYTPTYTEVMTLVDIISKSESRTLSDVTTLVDTIPRSISKTLSDVSTYVDTLLKNPARILTETTTLVDTLVRAVNKLQSEVLTLVDEFTRVWVIVRTYTEELPLVDTVLKNTGRIFAEVAVLVDSILKTPGKVLSEVSTLVDSTVKSISRTITDVFTLVDTFFGVRTIEATITEVMTLVDTIIKASGKVLTESVTAVDTIIKSTSRNLSDAFTLVDTVVRSASRNITETLALVDSIVTDLVTSTYAKVLTETLSLVDTIEKVFNHILSGIPSSIRSFGNNIIGAFIDMVKPTGILKSNKASGSVDSVNKPTGSVRGLDKPRGY